MTDILDRLTSTPSFVQMLMIIVASWRLAWFLIRDGGPFGLMREVRECLGFSHTLEGIPLPYFGGFPGTLFACMWCMSFWTSILMFLVYAAFPPVVAILATWGCACIIETVVGYWHIRSTPMRHYDDEPGGIQTHDNNRKEG